MTDVVDLRSDTVTRPSAQMRRVIAEAEVGDAVLGDDPTVLELERFAADLLGRDEALYFPSGVMANQAALLALTQPGTEGVIDAGGHILNWEEGGAAAWAGLQLQAVHTDDGLLTADAVARTIRPDSEYVPRTSVVCLENTHNSAGGRILRLERMRAIVEVARDRGVAVHLDGARLANAAVATGTPMRAWAALADTVMISLSKGLGAPVGSLLAGDGDRIREARRARRRLGGGMRQAGLLAAAGLFALQRNFERLAEDHARARRLAELARGIPGCHADEPETNIVMIRLDPPLDPERVAAELHHRDVWILPFGPQRLRAVTHLDVDDEGIARAGRALKEIVLSAEC